MENQDHNDWRVSREDEDPLVGSARRELGVVLGFAVTFALWSVGFCALFGYRTPAEGEPLRLVMGMPWWAFWGVMVPWFAAGLFTLWFAMFYMKDHDLGHDRDDQGNDDEIEAADAEKAASAGGEQP